MRRRTFLHSSGLITGVTAGPASLSVAARQPRSFHPLDELQLPGTKDVVVSADGQTAYAAVTDGFATVDISDPANLSTLAVERNLLADTDHGPLFDIRDVKVSGDRLIVAGPAGGEFYRLKGFFVYDVSDPATPERLMFHQTSYPIHNCDIHGTTVYLAPASPSRPLVILDISTEKPRVLTRWALVDHDDRYYDTPALLRPIHDVLVRDGYAYTSWWDAGTWILDVSDPSTPRYVSHVSDVSLEELQELQGFSEETDLAFEQPPGNDHSASLNDDGTLLAIGKESWDSPNDADSEGPSGIDLWSIADKSKPRKEATISPVPSQDATRTGIVTTAHNFDLRADRLYSSWYQDGVKIHDVRDPATPTLLAHWRTPNRRSFFTAQLVSPGEFFVASNRGIGTHEGGSILTFPDQAGEQADMPALEFTATPTRTATATSTTAPGFLALDALGSLGALSYLAWKRSKRSDQR